MPDDYIRKQTTANSERFITPALNEMEAKILGADDKAAQLEYDIFCRVRSSVADEGRKVAKVARAVAEVDVLASLAEVAASKGFVKPLVNDGDDLKIKNGRHPVVKHPITSLRRPGYAKASRSPPEPATTQQKPASARYRNPPWS